MTKFEEILKDIKEFHKKNTYRKPWFRGHNDEKYVLNSGIYRIDKDEDGIMNYERNAYNYFMHYGNLTADLSNLAEWDIIFKMQHHGMKTRLLDWSESFTTALYFANFNRDPDKTACIWILNPHALNNVAVGSDNFMPYQYFKEKYSYGRLISKKNPIEMPSLALVPNRNSERILAQQGMFTVQGTKGIPLNEEFEELTNKKQLFKVELPPETYKESQDFLRLCGVNHFTLFPDINGLAYYITYEKI